MKKFLLVLIGVAALVTVNLNAQVPTVGAVSLTVSNVYNAGTFTVTNNPPLISLKQQNFALSSTITANGGINGATNIYTFAPSVDGINFDTNAASAVLFTNALIGPGPETTTKSFNSSGILYYKLVQVAVTGTSSNNLLSYSGKISCP